MLVDSVPLLPLSAGTLLCLTSPKRFGCVIVHPAGRSPSPAHGIAILNGTVRVEQAISFLKKNKHRKK